MPNDELDLDQLNRVTAGYSSGSRQERAEVLVNNIIRQYMTNTVNESAIENLAKNKPVIARQAAAEGFDPKEVWEMLEAKAQEIQNEKGGRTF